MNINVGDIVARTSYKFDLLFRVIDIYHNEKGEKIVLLYGEDVRLMADAPYGDLRKMDNTEVQERKKVEDMRLSRSLYLFD